jgi:flagellar basal body P-ring protein FlgI
VPTVGRISNGALIEREVEFKLNNRILAGDLYKGLKAVRELIAYEQELIAHATGGERVIQGSAGDPLAP